MHVPTPPHSPLPVESTAHPYPIYRPSPPSLPFRGPAFSPVRDLERDLSLETSPREAGATSPPSQPAILRWPQLQKAYPFTSTDS